MVIKDIERDEVEFLSKAIGCKPIADIDNFTEDRLGTADLIEELDSSGSKIVEITGVTSKNIKPTVSVIIRGPITWFLMKLKDLYTMPCVLLDVWSNNRL